MSKFPKLTPKQLAFAHALITGKSPSEAYRVSYPNQSLSKPSLAVEANRLQKNPKVAAYLAAALADRRTEVLLTRDKKRLILGSIAQDGHEKAPSRIAAIHQDNLMTGDHKPVRIEGEITLHAIFSALGMSTGLPSPDEVLQLKQAVPVAPAVPAPVLTTAMERAG